MDILELAQAAVNSMNNTPNGITPTVVVKMPGKWGASKRKYLAGPKSPQGDVVKEDHEGVYVIFDTIDILAWCVASGAPVMIERKSA